LCQTLIELKQARLYNDLQNPRRSSTQSVFIQSLVKFATAVVNFL
jgi:hypothetical protein